MTTSTSPTVTFTLRPVASAPALARKLVKQAIDGAAQATQVGEDVAYVAGAFVLNSIVHTHAPVRVTLTQSDDFVLVEVEDSRLPGTRAQQPGQSRFYGLELVRKVASEFGFSHSDGTATSWARVDGCAHSEPSDLYC